MAAFRDDPTDLARPIGNCCRMAPPGSTIASPHLRPTRRGSEPRFTLYSLDASTWDSEDDFHTAMPQWSSHFPAYYGENLECLQ